MPWGDGAAPAGLQLRHHRHSRACAKGENVVVDGGAAASLRSIVKVVADVGLYVRRRRGTRRHRLRMQACSPRDRLVEVAANAARQ